MQIFLFFFQEKLSLFILSLMLLKPYCLLLPENGNISSKGIWMSDLQEKRIKKTLPILPKIDHHDFFTINSTVNQLLFELISLISVKLLMKKKKMYNDFKNIIYQEYLRNNCSCCYKNQNYIQNILIFFAWRYFPKQMAILNISNDSV